MTSQERQSLPSTSRLSPAKETYEFSCLIGGDPLPFSVVVPKTADVQKLIESISQEGEFDKLHCRVLDLTCWKVEINLELLEGPISRIRLEDLDHHPVVLDKPLLLISSLWEEEPPAGHVHVFVKVPEKGLGGPPPGTKLVKDTRIPDCDEITFTIPSKAAFPDLELSCISAEEVEEAYDEPSFVRKFRADLARPRVIRDPINPSLAKSLEDILPQNVREFKKYFEMQYGTSISDSDGIFESDGISESEGHVRQSEISQYLHILLSNNALTVDQFQASREGQIRVFLLHHLAAEFQRRGHRANREHWTFPLVALSLGPELTKYRYTPMNHFRLEIKGFPHCIFEVNSCKNQTDLCRMILQASCLARLGNRLRCSNTTDPVVIMAIYVDSQLRAHEYLLYQPNAGNQKVLYHTKIFNLHYSDKAFDFTFRMYNFLSRAIDDSCKLRNTLQELDKIKNAITNGPYYSALTSTRPARDHMRDRLVQESLEAAGYELMLVPITGLKQTMREATSSDGSRVVLKLVEDDTDELAILKYLNQIISEKNRTIELHGIVEVKAPTVIALRWRIPLDDYFNIHSPPESAASFPEQFLEGVAFLHEHKVAHLDLKPGNVVVDGVDRERPPRLVIIDFDLSVFVENERTTIKGFCGTPPWVAPEVGTCDGPDLTYSPILADRWACGKMMFYLGTLLPGSGDGSRHRVQERLRDQLTSDDPESRPSLEEVLGAYRKGVKRIAEAEKSVEM